MSNGAFRPHSFGRHSEAPPGEARRSSNQFRPYRGEQYYDLPVLKSSPWGWLIASYLFVGGLAGGAQVLATVADLAGGAAHRPVVRAGRYLALAGALVSPILLILDLHTPTRWYNMLRIVRRTSPMNLGSWILTAFGFTTGLAALLTFISDRKGAREAPTLERAAELGAAVTGAAMATYTATLLSSTSTPTWLTGAKQLPILFGSTAIASGEAAIDFSLCLAGAPSVSRRPLSALALIAAGGQWWAMRALEREWKKRGVTTPAQDRTLHQIDMLVKIGGIAAPAIVQAGMLASGKSLRPLTLTVALGTLLGGFAERWLIVAAGNRSAESPADYFRITQPKGSVG